jgi:hypothetical protein
MAPLTAGGSLSLALSQALIAGSSPAVADARWLSSNSPRRQHWVRRSLPFTATTTRPSAEGSLNGMSFDGSVPEFNDRDVVVLTELLSR